MDAEFDLQGCEPSLERADDARRDAGRMPVHAHDRTEGLKPEWVRQPPQEFVAAVVVHDGLAHDGTQRGHALPQPWRHTPAIQGKISAACPSCHRSSTDSLVCRVYQRVGPLCAAGKLP
jgi:hypothetical protein